MADQSSQLVQKLWNYCNILRDDGLSYGDYVEQLTFLLFLKMADEQSMPPLNKRSPIPKGYDWPSCSLRTGMSWKPTIAIAGDAWEREGHARCHLPQGAEQNSRPGEAAAADCRSDRQGTWTSLSADVKGDAYEGLLEKNAEDVKGGAGQYFTPRPLIGRWSTSCGPSPR